MQWDWPVIANYFEAKAYAVWKAERDGCSVPYRLITEKEHNAMRSHAQSRRDNKMLREDAVMMGADAIRDRANTNLQYGSECSVVAFPPNEKGFRDVFGNVWQWCEDHFHPYEKFEVSEYYHDFSTPCFDGHHHMTLGGSFISTGDLASIYARYHFRPHFHQHAGFRLARYEDGGDAATVDAVRID